MSSLPSTLLARWGVVALLSTAFAEVSLAAPGEFPPAVAAIVQQAAADGLPVAALESKAREGLAKGVDESRIATAVSALAAQMQAASVLLAVMGQGEDRELLVSASARALQIGASGAAVRAAASGDALSRASAVRALGDLVALGFPEDRSLALAQAVSRTGQPVRNLDLLAGAAATLLAQGVPQGQVLQQVSKDVSTTSANGDPPAWGAGGSKGKDPSGNGNGNGQDHAPGQQKK